MVAVMKSETQKSIADWAQETFGAAPDLLALVERASLELDELKQAVDENDVVEAGKETADVMILLYRLMELLELDLHAEVDAKMRINRSRRWTGRGDGTGSHKK